MVMGLGQRAAGGRVDPLRAGDLGARAPEPTGAGMALQPRRLEHALVGDLLQQLVLERVFAAVNAEALVARHDQMPMQQGRQRARRRRVDRSERLVPEHMADDRRLLQRWRSPAAARPDAPAARRSGSTAL